MLSYIENTYRALHRHEYSNEASESRLWKRLWSTGNICKDSLQYAQLDGSTSRFRRRKAYRKKGKWISRAPCHASSCAAEGFPAWQTILGTVYTCRFSRLESQSRSYRFHFCALSCVAQAGPVWRKTSYIGHNYKGSRLLQCLWPCN